MPAYKPPKMVGYPHSHTPTGARLGSHEGMERETKREKFGAIERKVVSAGRGWGAVVGAVVIVLGAIYVLFIL